MKTRLLRRLRRKARRNIEICVPTISPEHGYYFFNKYLMRAYAPRKRYDKYPWTKNAFTKYYETPEDVRKEYQYVLWSETYRLLMKYKAKVENRRRQRDLRKLVREFGL